MNFQLNYRGKTQYGGFRFSCSLEHDEETYKRLSKLKDLIDDKKFKTSNPVYKKDSVSDYVSLTCKRSFHNFRQSDVGNTYDVHVEAMQKEYEGKSYINFEVSKAKLVRKVDRGSCISSDFSV